MGDTNPTNTLRLFSLADTFGWSQAELTTTVERLDGAGGLDDGAAGALPERYEDLGLLGRGGQGVVRLVCDHHLGRLAALKLLTRGDSPTARALFLAETRTTARLEHPGIVPIYDRGTTAEGRPWYAMRYVEGRSLEQALGPGGLSLQRRVEVLLRVSEAVAYAHHNQVVHLDLKPANVLLGPFGEVLVTDWGLAQPVGELSEDAAVRGAGTVAYMPPEQKVGTRTIRPTADVYALGSTLLQMLTDARPQPGETPTASGPLWDLVRAARGWYPDERPADAAAFAEALRSWLDGQARRDAAAALVARAASLVPEIERCATRAAQAEGEADAVLSALPSHAPIGQRRPGWALLDQAEGLHRKGRQLEQERLALLRRALEEAPEEEAARAALIQHHRRAMQAAEEANDEAEQDVHTAALRGLDPVGQAAWLRGDGRLRILTTPPATARLFKLQPRDRALVPVPARVLGRTPLDVTLPRGRYVVSLQAPGREPVSYPVHIIRGADWADIPPGAEEPIAVPLPPRLARDEAYVPPGWFVAGGDPKAVDSLPKQRVWVDGFIIARRPVSNRAYLRFLNALVEAGDPEAAAQALPSGTDEDAPFVRGPDGRYRLTEQLAALWHPDGPVMRVTPASALAYAAWRAEGDGLPWRLPHGLEWEKAARGVDRRPFAMGEHLTPAHANVAGSLSGLASPQPLEAFTLDRSPYGVMGLTGNVRDICGSRYVQGGRGLDGQRLDLAVHMDGGACHEVRGGSFSSPPAYCRAACRFGVPVDGLSKTAGFRLARSWP